MADRGVVLVTGASSGIGFATAALFAARGYRTFGTARELGAHPAPKDVEMVKLDVRSDESMNAAVDAVLGTASLRLALTAGPRRSLMSALLRWVLSESGARPTHTLPCCWHGMLSLAPARRHRCLVP
jgi:NAD(P)-dependent dehydrogenase (short-subunit alcohol dehydrogenase family)